MRALLFHPKLFRNILFIENPLSPSYQRFTHTFLCKNATLKNGNDPSRLGFASSYQAPRKSVTFCLTDNLVNHFHQLSKSFFRFYADLTRIKLLSLYLKCISPANQTWQTNVLHFSGQSKSGDGGSENPLGDEFEKLTQNLPPLLMDFVDPITTPGPFLALRNIFSVLFVIRPFYDPSFSHQVVLDGAKQALFVISDNLSRADTNTLEGLIAPKALEVVKENLVKFNPTQLADLKVEEQDVVFWLAKEIKTIEEADRKFIEFTVIFHVIRDHQEKMANPEKRSFFMPDPDMTFCNYRFIREYTKGVDGEWICNRLNHFKWGHFIKASPFAS
ncbi:uncharacterized protein LOC107366652 [Tetranychus urticae]|uniref:Tim44-like domain-containing protein n=1 Tax=Tetranychus urticae TaxID=32264 RepID=T1KRU1_TETUR|nr:uncharacterized protein LOC107366652 [Tetranychus urticae]